MSLAGKIAIVTGAARGIGAGIVRALAAQGARVSYIRETVFIRGDSLLTDSRF